VIPAGTGNDFCRGMGLPTDIRTAISAIIDGNCKQVDLMDVRGELTRQQHSRYVASVVSTGYDAQVNARTNAHKVSIGSLTYGFEAIRQMTEFAPLQYSLEIDGVRRDLEAILVAVANAGVYGGGVQICPSSDPADGLLDITIIHPASRLEFCSAIPKLYSGKLDEHPKVEILHARRIRISGPDLTPMADGEELGSFPLDIRIAPGVLQLVGATA
jgi:diacylglycerol kinase (ATP)